jgi:hypothetical protein
MFLSLNNLFHKYMHNYHFLLPVVYIACLLKDGVRHNLFRQDFHSVLLNYSVVSVFFSPAAPIADTSVKKYISQMSVPLFGPHKLCGSLWPKPYFKLSPLPIFLSSTCHISLFIFLFLAYWK